MLTNLRVRQRQGERAMTDGWGWIGNTELSVSAELGYIDGAVFHVSHHLQQTQPAPKVHHPEKQACPDTNPYTLTKQ